ncbi:nicotinate phosphoribosyltransferase [Rhizophlyctis rosea]|nr:nicotinate phosphoribosyltransferase [Rhizophlyctis rosea]
MPPPTPPSFIKLDSILDNDLYKFTMQQAVLELYPDVDVVYRFKNRSEGGHKFTVEAVERLRRSIDALADLHLTPHELTTLRHTCPYLTPTYVSYLQRFRYDPTNHITLSLSPQNTLSLTITGRWVDTILYEVPLLALISETYFTYVDTDWSMEGQVQKAREKRDALIRSGCVWADFGTRRRRCRSVQEVVVGVMCQSGGGEGEGRFVGTSNVSLACKYGIRAVGTVAHEWVMAHSALHPLQTSNSTAYTLWHKIYYGTPQLLIALTDTFTTNLFLHDFPPSLASQYTGFRQDSGDPLKFVDRIIEWGYTCGVDMRGKSLVFSDALDVEGCTRIKEYVEGKEKGLRPSFGIGTKLTNDFTQTSTGLPSKALNIVIKMERCNRVNVVKLSDDEGKYQGDEKAVRDAVEVLRRVVGRVGF